MKINIITILINFLVFHNSIYLEIIKNLKFNNFNESNNYK